MGEPQLGPVEPTTNRLCRLFSLNFNWDAKIRKGSRSGPQIDKPANVLSLENAAELVRAGIQGFFFVYATEDDSILPPLVKRSSFVGLSNS
jgi:hypothetical protein